MTACLGQLGGSGSNAAGYQCRGSFTIDGRHYNEIIPGTTLLPLGTTVRGVIDPGDPALISTAGSGGQRARVVAGVPRFRSFWPSPSRLLVVAVVIRMAP